MSLFFEKIQFTLSPSLRSTVSSIPGERLRRSLEGNHHLVLCWSHCGGVWYEKSSHYNSWWLSLTLSVCSLQLTFPGPKRHFCFSVWCAIQELCGLLSWKHNVSSVPEGFLTLWLLFSCISCVSVLLQSILLLSRLWSHIAMDFITVFSSSGSSIVLLSIKDKCIVLYHKWLFICQVTCLIDFQKCVLSLWSLWRHSFGPWSIVCVGPFGKISTSSCGTGLPSFCLSIFRPIAKFSISTGF